MAGRALRKKIFAEIETRGGVDYLLDYIAEGGTVLDLATEMGCSRSYLSRHLNAEPKYRDALDQARREYSDTLADETLVIADALAVEGVTREEIMVAKERIDVRKWWAAVNNPDRYRQDKGGATVVLNINQLHLDALRKHRDGGITIEGTVADEQGGEQSI
jgi:AraC-like DNA-binding protein